MHDECCAIDGKIIAPSGTAMLDARAALAKWERGKGE